LSVQLNGIPCTGFNAERQVTSWYLAWSARRSASVSAAVPPVFTAFATSRVVGLRGPRSKSRGNDAMWFAFVSPTGYTLAVSLSNHEFVASRLS
jgi:hypothetical protein